MTTTQLREKGAALEPVGVEGCGTCAALSGSRQIARDAGALDAVARCNREIGNHPHRQSARAGEMRIWGVVQ
ncbi:hypothetical protein ACVV2G_27180 [Streptomyces ziwulingensis]